MPSVCYKIDFSGLYIIELTKCVSLFQPGAQQVKKEENVTINFKINSSLTI